eukprot:CAMPEP_0168188862 /NCGR_PEP_ID=MMETSP0139_2-20121125/15981_1 /TAXON_ID=44445 /ORGANISM="Pseudo-nitzschia australis, Strain 10249 10 AB" /LENGTH=137 /DNA_ID=CAMNT_0008111543 /DNA_START=1 /DNA_END=410 /DNA_ORIENTATION=-
MSTGKEAEWTIHTSHKSRRPATATATVIPQAPKPEPLKPSPEQTRKPSKYSEQARKPEPSTPRKPEPSKLTPKPEPSKPRKPEPHIDTASIASTDSDDSMNDDDRHTKRVKDFVSPSKLVPITNQGTSDDVSTFRQV